MQTAVSMDCSTVIQVSSEISVSACIYHLICVEHVNVSINWSSSNELRVNWSVSEQILSLGDTLTVQWKITDTTQWLPIDNKLSQSNNYQVNSI